MQRVHIEFQRVQSWLFAVPRLRAMVGANALLGETLRVELPKLARETGRGWMLASNNEAYPCADGSDPLKDHDNPSADAKDGILSRDSGCDDKNRPFEKKSRPDGQAWFWFYESGAGRFARDYVKSEPLKKLLDAVEKVKALRNDVAHNEPTPKLMNDAHTSMQSATLWSTNGTFLSQPLVQEILKALGEANPENLLERLIIEARRRLREPSPATEGRP